MLTVHGSPPVKKRTASAGPEELRFDRLDHWITNTEEDAAGKFKRRNCRNCSLNKKPDSKTVYLCDKCKVPLHTFCFKARIHELVGLFLVGFFLLGKLLSNFSAFNKILFPQFLEGTKNSIVYTVRWPKLSYTP
jgi:hypothetical protein